MRKKLLAVLLSVCMLLTVLPMGLLAGAADRDSPNDPAGGESKSGGSSVNTPITTTTTVENAWVTRLSLPKYAKDFYNQLVRGSDNDRPRSDLFTVESNYVVDTGKKEKEISQVEAVREIVFTELSYLGDSGPLTGEVLGQEENYTVGVTGGDKAISFQNLNSGNLVKTSAFNGVFVTSVRKTDNASYDADLTAAKETILAVCHAFDRDHPEVFWLTGQTKLRILNATVNRNGRPVQESFFFYVLADNAGFCVRQAEYAPSGAIQNAIKKRDAAVKSILASVPKTGTYEKVQALNKWLTQHNEYNTTPNLTTLGCGPHRCLGALLGSTGTSGPVCEGYARAFKVLCDQLRIPCILEDGYARSTPGGAMGLHMWNSVKMPDNSWYGADITWDDPLVPGKSGALTGRENENYLLVGYSSVINGMRFDISHQMSCQMIEGAPFAAGPYLNSATFGMEEEPAEGLPFVDVPAGAYYVDAVKWALDSKVTTGTSATKFSPNATCTRGQVVTFLWRAMGDPRPTTTKNPFADVSPSDYYYNAVLWAAEKGITSGTSTTKFSPNQTCSKAHIVTFLWRCMGKPGDKGSAAWYADAVSWANQKNLLSGTGTAFVPTDNCPRADVVTYLFRTLSK